MGSHKKKGCYYPEQVPPPLVPDYVVTGDPVPDSTGDYFYEGEYNGQPYYKRKDGAFFLFWNTTVFNAWMIRIQLGLGSNNWYHYVTIVGVYSPSGDYSGNPVVSEA